MSRSFTLLVITLISTLIAACAGPSAAAPATVKSADSVQAIDVKATDMLKFEPATITVKQGIPVRLTLTSTGALEHDWVVDNLDGKKVRVHAAPRASATVEFTPMAAGTYEFYCSIPGHREAGMKGTLVVQ
ncbi:MAG: cupredoxin domain-containing protein [Chloroflexi bacterium]|nr:cupredoxin domain-containing protein [Chloroflexota bacterium]